MLFESTDNSKKIPHIINFPDDENNNNNNYCKKESIYELLIKHDGNYQAVSKILDEKINATNTLIRELTSTINELPSEEFEWKLQKLKDDNRETRMLCEEFQKISNRNQKNNLEEEGKENFESIQKILSEKPPKVPMSRKPNVAIESRIKCVNDLNSEYAYARENGYKKVDELWQESNSDNYLEIDSEYDNIRQRERKYNSRTAMGRLYRIKSDADIVSNDRSYTTDPEFIKNWRHRVTIPEPFQMTIRDENKKREIQRNFRALEFQKEKEERERQEIEETKKQFRANPVPAHVFIPKYHSMVEEANCRRQVIRDYSKDILKSVEKPFSFYTRDFRQSVKRKSDDINKNQPVQSSFGERQKTIIRAKPIPYTSKEKTNMEKLKEDELFRKVKAEIRAKHLLEESKMPGCMEERMRLQEEKRLQKQRNMEGCNCQTSKLRKSVPDFSKIHKAWQEEVRLSSKEPMFTEPKPFRLVSEERAHSRSSRNSGDGPQMNLSNSLNDLTNRHAFGSEWNKSIKTALEIAKPYTTKATLLREQALRAKLEEQEKRKYQKELNKLAKRKKEQELEDKLRKSLENSVALPKTKQRQRLNELKYEDELKQENYKNDIERLNERVNQMPLLCERDYKRCSNNNNIEQVVADYSVTGSDGGLTGTNGKFPPYNSRDHYGENISYKSTTQASTLDSHKNKNNNKNDYENYYENDYENDFEEIEELP